MKINWRKQIIDQSGHMLAGGVIGFLISLASGGCVPCGASIAVLVGLVREIVQHDGHIRGRGSFTDIAFWTIGGAIGAFFAA